MTFTSNITETNDPVNPPSQHEVDELHAANAIGSLLTFLKGGGNVRNVNPVMSNPGDTGLGGLTPKTDYTQPVNNVGQLSDRTVDTNTTALNATIPTTPAAAPGSTANPVPGGAQVSSPFGEDRNNHIHAGVDLAVPNGTGLVAAISGKVIHASNDDPNGYGNMIEIQGANGMSVRYGHMSSMDVQVGQDIQAGQSIGKSGGAKGAPGSGDSTGPHLHFEVRENGQAVDPTGFLQNAGNTALPAGATSTAPEVTTITRPSRSISPEDATDTALQRLTAAVNDSDDPGSQNLVTKEVETRVKPGQPLPPGTGTGDTTNLSGMDKYFGAVLNGIGAPINNITLGFMRALMRSEGGSEDNPFNVTENAPGATTINSHGVKRYADQQTGITSTIRLMLNGLYPGLINALRAGNDAESIIQGFASSPWVGGGSGGEADLIRRIMAGG